ncbi:HAD family phosphatase [Actinospica durhamensis]|uniref:HAD family phosphatase n=1 Tax=Actinospica durhamensis TaxID=1508375 RepID=A0A941EP81_9ACTN|nr:HAD family hydrolase [Actinospica durhamensis]MBR7832644.1 HAD family phosphatase [Actinospica durhamensis]
MPALPRLIATDLDGTLLDDRRELTARTVAAVRAAVALGVEVVLVTARPPRTVAPLVARLGGGVEALCGNGTLLAEYSLDGTWRSTRIKTFDPAEASRIVEQLRPVLPDAGFALETGDEVIFEAAFGLGAVTDERRVLTEDLLGTIAASGPSIKVLARAWERSADAMVELAERTLTVDAEISHSGGRGLLEIAPPGASKASGLAWLCARRGIEAAQVVAFGDMPNDLPMLRWAGVGHAVANAHPEVLAAADRVVGHHAEEGVAAALEDLLAGARVTG